MIFTLLIIKSFYFMLPAYFANMAPVMVKNMFNKLAFPVDFNKKIKNKPILGKNKTLRGLIFGILFAIMIAYLQLLLHNNYDYFKTISLLDYSKWFLFGFLMGFGAIFGDALESFFKRRLSYNPGQPFVPFDQIDFVIGALIFALPLVKMSFVFIITVLILSFILHMAVNHIAFYLKIRNERW